MTRRSAASGAGLGRDKLGTAARALLMRTTTMSAGRDCQILTKRNPARLPEPADRHRAQLCYRSASKATTRAPRPLYAGRPTARMSRLAEFQACIDHRTGTSQASATAAARGWPRLARLVASRAGVASRHEYRPRSAWRPTGFEPQPTEAEGSSPIGPAQVPLVLETALYGCSGPGRYFWRWCGGPR